jgi:N-acetylglucosamine kinase-like BadF-type ATPase
MSPTGTGAWPDGQGDGQLACHAKAPDVLAVGVDAGGSHTDLVIADRGRWHHERFPSANPASVGAASANAVWRRILSAIHVRLDGHVVSAWIGTAAFGPAGTWPALEELQSLGSRLGLRGDVFVCNDLLPLLLAPPLGGIGVVLAVGTGTGCWAADGHAIATVGGMEYLASDEGSAWQLGLDGLRAATKAADGRGPATSLSRHLATAGGEGVAALARRLAATPYPKASVAALAPAVFDAWLDGDGVAGKVVDVALGELVLAAAGASRSVALDRAKVLLSGGVLRGCPPFADALSERLRGAGFHPLPALAEPVASLVHLAAGPDRRPAKLVTTARRERRLLHLPLGQP